MALTSVFSLHRSQFYLFFTDFRERSPTWTSSNSFFFSLSLSLSQKTEETQRHAAGVAEFHTVAEFQMTSGLSLSLSLSLSLATSLDTSGDGWNRWITGEAVFFSFFRSVGFGFFFFFVHALNQQRRLDDGANDVSDERQRKDIAALKKNNNNTDRRRGRTVNWWDHQWRPGAHLLWMHWIACKNEENKTNKPNHNEEKGRERWFRIHKKRIDCVVVVSNRNNEGNGGKLKRKTRKKNSFRFSFFFF